MDYNSFWQPWGNNKEMESKSVANEKTLGEYFKKKSTKTKWQKLIHDIVDYNKLIFLKRADEDDRLQNEYWQESHDNCLEYYTEAAKELSAVGFDAASFLSAGNNLLHTDFN